MTMWAKQTGNVMDLGFGATRNGKKINGIIIHHAASTNALGYVAGENSRNSHPSYHIASSGAVTGIVNVNKRPFSTAHIVDQQAITVEIDNSSVGGNWPVSSAALKSLAAIIADHCKQRGYTKAARSIRGVNQKEFFVGWHSQYTATACPGPFVMANLDNVIAAVNEILNPPPVVTPPVVTPPVVEPPVVEPPVLNPDFDKFDELLNTVVDEAAKHVAGKTRLKIYKIVRNVNAIIASIGAVGTATAAFIGGEIGAQVSAYSVIVLVISTAIGSASANLASKNIQQ